MFKEAIQNRMRSLGAKLWHLCSRLDVLAIFFRDRLMKAWNKLSSEVARVGGVIAYKASLHKRKHELFPLLESWDEEGWEDDGVM